MWKRFKTALTILGGLDLAVSTLICIGLAVEAHGAQKEQERVAALRKAIHDSGIWAKPGATNIPITKEEPSKHEPKENPMGSGSVLGGIYDEYRP